MEKQLPIGMPRIFVGPPFFLSSRSPLRASTRALESMDFGRSADFAEPQIGSTSLSIVGGDASTAADRIHRVPDGGLGRRWAGHAALDSQCAK